MKDSSTRHNRSCKDVLILVLMDTLDCIVDIYINYFVKQPRVQCINICFAYTSKTT